MCCCVCGGSVVATDGSAYAASPPVAGLLPLGWYGGCIVLIAKKSGVRLPEFTNFGMPVSADAGEFDASFSDTPSASTAEIELAAGLLSAFG